MSKALSGPLKFNHMTSLYVTINRVMDDKIFIGFPISDTGPRFTHVYFIHFYLCSFP